MINTTVQIEHKQDFEEQGFYSKSYVARDKRLSRDVAVKDILVKNLTSEADFEKYFAEALKLSMAAHPKVLGVYYVGIDESTDIKVPRIVTKYFKNGSLNSLLSKSYKDNGRTLGLDHVIRIAHQVIQGMIHLHALDILHLDLKASNIYVGDDNEMVIGDFGQSKFIKDEIAIDPGNLYPAISPPEASSHKAVDKTADIYQFGLLLYSLVAYDKYREAIDKTYQIDTETLKSTFRGENNEEARKKFKENMKAYLAALKTGTFPEKKFRHYVHPVLKSIIQKCLEKVENRYNNFYEIQTDLNSITLSNDLVDLHQKLDQPDVVYFTKDGKPCSIAVASADGKYSLTPHKNERHIKASDKVRVSETKLVKEMFNLAEEL